MHLMTREHEKILAKNDSILEKIILQIPRPKIESTKDIFHDLMSCIIEQQIHYRSTKGIFSKALERASIIKLTIHNFHLFEKHSLSQIKLSKGKYETMMSFIDYWSNNSKDFTTLSDNDLN